MMNTRCVSTTSLWWIQDAYLQLVYDEKQDAYLQLVYDEYKIRIYN